MMNHQYSQIPPHAYIPQQMMGPPPPPHHHHSHPHQHQNQSAYQPNPPHAHPYTQHQHPPHPGPQPPDYRASHFQQSGRPLIVSTPASYMPQYHPQMMPHHMPAVFYRPSHLHPNIPPFYPSQEVHQPPPDIHSPASLPQDAVTSNPASSPARSAEAIVESGEAKYQTPMTSSSSVHESPMVSGLAPLPAGKYRKPLRLPWYSAPGQPFPPRKPRITKPKVYSPVTNHHVPQDGPTIASNGPQNPDFITVNGVPDEKFSKDSTSSNLLPDSTQIDQKAHPLEPESTVLLPPPHLSSKLGTSFASGIPVIPFIPAIHRPRKSADITAAPMGRATALNIDTDSWEYEISDEHSVPATSDGQSRMSQPSHTPKSWADLVRSNADKPSGVSSNMPILPLNGVPIIIANIGDTKTRSLADVFRTFVVHQGGSHPDRLIPLIEPRGLINTGNMCFMNSILQALLFCGPFFIFLDAISRNVAHRFKSETPLIDAMIMFMREFRRLDSTPPVQGNKNNPDVALTGDPFVPGYVYEAVRGLERFSSMRHGHQQDAEEFLNFFLDVLHEECVAVNKTEEGSKLNNRTSNSFISTESDEPGWLEVGHRQKAAITRSVGNLSGKSPITAIFGGQMRSELRVTGQRNSVTREPYLSLQLDIQNSNINNILDALRHLGTPEQLQGGDFKSPRGAIASVTRQVFIETLPPVLILHLKRFRYNDAGGTQKIWKGIGYPLDLEIPSEVLSPARRSTPQAPRYKLTSVVYHHGKSATNGHYTVDVKRKDGWLRIDDTIVKRISAREVVVDDVMHAADTRRKGSGEDNGWKEVSFATKVTGKAPTTIANSSKDDKVAYLLFYELQ